MEEKLTVVQQVPALSLAYIGDAVYELKVRQYFLDRGIVKTADLHNKAVSMVCAPFQAKVSRLLEAELAEAELAVFKRGRNAKSGHQPQGATVVQYRRASGLETLLGYWHLSGQEDRLAWFFARLFAIYEEEQA